LLLLLLGHVLHSDGCVDALSQKRVLLLRHGRTEMNDYLKNVPYNARDFQDPMLIDTRLTSVGRKQAEDAARALRERGDVELVVCSPLTRALATAEIAFARAGPPLPIVVQPLCAERRWHGSDLGRELGTLRDEFGGEHIDWSFLPARGGWGYVPDPPPARGPIAEEAETDFIERMRSLRDWLGARPERTIAVVTHWGVIYALTGKQVKNCVQLECALDELDPGAHLLDDASPAPIPAP
jgi:broad specificity phosphatase PhoE